MAACGGNYILDNGADMRNSVNGQAGDAPVSQDAGQRGGMGLSAMPLLEKEIPEGLTFTDLQGAAKIFWVYQHPEEDENDPRNDFEFVARVYEFLRAAAARNQGMS